MVTELYLVNTTIKPVFLDMPFIMRQPPRIRLKAHSDFINRVKEQYPRFDCPYLGLFENDTLYVFDDLELRATELSLVQDGVVLGARAETLDEFIDRYKKEYISLSTGRITPITAVVEFSPTELYPEVMKKLEAKYDIKRIQVG